MIRIPDSQFPAFDADLFDEAIEEAQRLVEYYADVHEYYTGAGAIEQAKHVHWIRAAFLYTLKVIETGKKKAEAEAEE